MGRIGNAASHGAAALLTLFILHAAVHSFNNGGTLESVSVSIYMYFISSTYHSMQNHTAHKYILRIIDHSMIYVAISGTCANCRRRLDRLAGNDSIMGNYALGNIIKSIATKVNHKLSQLQEWLYFAIGSLMSGLSETFTFLIISRVIQGFGAGVMMSLSQIVPKLAFEIPLRYKIMGIVGSVWGFQVL